MQLDQLKRREFISLLGGAAMVWPLAARAQQAAMPVIGFMSARSPEDSEHLVEAFRRGLREGGFVEGQNVAIEFRWARGQYDLLPAMAADLVSRGVSVLTSAGSAAALAARCKNARRGSFMLNLPHIIQSPRRRGRAASAAS
jgi:putative ABC transport system substrate-binding protein